MAEEESASLGCQFISRNKYLNGTPYPQPQGDPLILKLSSMISQIPIEEHDADLTDYLTAQQSIIQPHINEPILQGNTMSPETYPHKLLAMLVANNLKPYMAPLYCVAPSSDLALCALKLGRFTPTSWEFNQDWLKEVQSGTIGGFVGILSLVLSTYYLNSLQQLDDDHIVKLAVGGLHAVHELMSANALNSHLKDTIEELNKISTDNYIFPAWTRDDLEACLVANFLNSACKLLDNETCLHDQRQWWIDTGMKEKIERLTNDLRPNASAAYIIAYTSAVGVQNLELAEHIVAQGYKLASTNNRPWSEALLKHMMGTCIWTGSSGTYTVGQVKAVLNDMDAAKERCWNWLPASMKDDLNNRMAATGKLCAQLSLLGLADDVPLPKKQPAAESSKEKKKEEEGNKAKSFAATRVSTDVVNQLQLCANCASGSSSSGQMKQCSQCKSVVYCSRECQVEHWKVHKGNCRKAWT